MAEGPLVSGSSNPVNSRGMLLTLTGQEVEEQAMEPPAAEKIGFQQGIRP